jgi:hypothetical protein
MTRITKKSVATSWNFKYYFVYARACVCVYVCACVRACVMYTFCRRVLRWEQIIILHQAFELEFHYPIFLLIHKCEWCWHVHFIISTTVTSFRSLSKNRYLVQSNMNVIQKRTHCFVSGSNPIHRRANKWTPTDTNNHCQQSHLHKEWNDLNCDRWRDLQGCFVYVICEDLLYLQCQTERN